MNHTRVESQERQSEHNESTTVRLMSLGDIQSFNILYQQYHLSVHANILKLIKSQELAAELLQDVFLALWQNRHKFTNEESVGGWLFVVSYNKSLNVLRKKLKESISFVAELPLELMSPEDDATEKEERYQFQLELLDQAINNLPARKKEVFKLCRFEGRSKEDVAKLLGISQQSVSDYLKQSNKIIKDYVLDHYPTYVGNLLLILSVL